MTYYQYTCPVCNRRFEALRRGRRTCSKKCFYIFWSRPVIKNCGFCGIELKRNASRMKRVVRAFCNRTCAHSWEKTGKMKFKQLRDKQWCLKAYKKQSLLKIAQQLSCGETTVYKWFKIHGIKLDRKQWLRGDKHYFWKGGITKFCRQIRTCSEYLQWKKSVLIRCPKICILCGSTEQLEVDHIKQLKFILLDNNIKTLDEARGCKELWDIKNGRILCRKCNMIGCNINRQLFSNQTPK